MNKKIHDIYKIQRKMQERLAKMAIFIKVNKKLTIAIAILGYNW